MRGKLIFFMISGVLGISLSHHFFSWKLLVLLILYLLFVYTKESLLLLSISTLIILIFAIHFTFIDRLNQTKLLSTESSLKGEIISNPEIDGDRLRFTFHTSHNEKVLITYTIKSLQEKLQLEELSYGSRCELKGELQRPNTATNDNAFDYHQYLKRKSIHWTYSLEESPLNQCGRKHTNLFGDLFAWRGEMLKKIDRELPKPASGFVKALVFGDKSSISPSVMTAFRAFGLSHLLAISGLHVGLVTGAIFIGFIRAGITREKALFVLLGSLPVYILLTGAAPSVIRSGMMAILLGIAFFLKYRVSVLDTISAVALMMMVIDPYYVFEPGFQLSFAVTLALVLSSRLLLSGNYVAAVVKASIVAQFVSLPIVAYHFFEVSFLSVPLNVLYIPLLSFLILPLSFFAFLLILVTPDASFLAIGPLNLLLESSIFLLETIRRYAFAFQWTIGRPGFWMLLLLSCASLFIFHFWEQKRWRRVMAIATFVLLLPSLSHHLNPFGEVAILDVGQGESIYIELPFRKQVFLIDTGGSLPFTKPDWARKKDPFETGEDVITPFLKAKGIKRLDALLLTHGDIDHIGGAKAILETFDVKKMYINEAPLEGEYEKEVVKKALDTRTEIERISEGFRIGSGENTLHILSPIPGKAGLAQSQNDQSIVIYAELGGLTWVFTGDLEAEGEAELLRHYPNLRSDILKVGHHGSKTSSSDRFLDQVKAKIAIISVGRGNRYGHPHPEVLEALKDRDMIIWRTDKSGAFHYKFRSKTGTFFSPAHILK